MKNHRQPKYSVTTSSPVQFKRAPGTKPVQPPSHIQPLSSFQGAGGSCNSVLLEQPDDDQVKENIRSVSRSSSRGGHRPPTSTTSQNNTSQGAQGALVQSAPVTYVESSAPEGHAVVAVDGSDPRSRRGLHLDEFTLPSLIQASTGSGNCSQQQQTRRAPPARKTTTSTDASVSLTTFVPISSPGTAGGTARAASGHGAKLPVIGSSVKDRRDHANHTAASAVEEVTDTPLGGTSTEAKLLPPEAIINPASGRVLYPSAAAIPRTASTANTNRSSVTPHTAFPTSARRPMPKTSQGRGSRSRGGKKRGGVRGRKRRGSDSALGDSHISGDEMTLSGDEGEDRTQTVLVHLPEFPATARNRAPKHPPNLNSHMMPSSARSLCQILPFGPPPVLAPASTLTGKNFNERTVVQAAGSVPVKVFEAVPSSGTTVDNVAPTGTQHHQPGPSAEPTINKVSQKKKRGSSAMKDEHGDHEEVRALVVDGGDPDTKEPTPEVSPNTTSKKSTLTSVRFAPTTPRTATPPTSRVDQLVNLLHSLKHQAPSEREQLELKVLREQVQEVLLGSNVSTTQTPFTKDLGAFAKTPSLMSLAPIATGTDVEEPSSPDQALIDQLPPQSPPTASAPRRRLSLVNFFERDTFGGDLSITRRSPLKASPKEDALGDFLEGDTEIDSDASDSGLSTIGATRDGGGSFISALALQSFQLNAKDEPFYTPVTVQCAVLFVDITGYSKVSKMLESQGAFALFNAVNPYMTQLIDIIVNEFHGQVVKFCGDALMVVWYGHTLAPNHLVEQAYYCSTALLNRCAESHVEGLDNEVTFGIHLGLTYGEITSRVMRSGAVRHMESHFHLIEGEPIVEMGTVVETATRGALCVGENVANLLPQGTVIKPTKVDKVFRVVIQDQLAIAGITGGAPQSASNGAAFGVCQVVEDSRHRQAHYTKFIHPAIVELGHRGITQTAMAKMRQLAVMFILKTDHDGEHRSDVDDWFAEVQQIMEEHRCSIIQVIHDDKGLHVVAAANLHISDRTPAVSAVRVATALKVRSVNSAIGVACGIAFCGVVGGPQASRYDITGEPCVRACRLMQYGEAHGKSIVLDESVVRYANDLSLTVPIHGPPDKDGESTPLTANIKGEGEPIPLFTVAEVDTLILSSVISGTRYCPKVHEDLCEELRTKVVEKGAQRSSALLVGGIGTGKVVLCVRAVYRTGVVPVLHNAVENAPPLDIVRTICQWFKSYKDPKISSLAELALQARDQSHNLLAIRRALKLIFTSIDMGLRTALIVQQSQKLDPMSLSFLRQAMDPTLNPPELSPGRWLVFATFVPQYGKINSATMNAVLGPNSLQVEVGALPVAETEALANFVLGWRISANMLVAIAHMSERVVELVVVTAKEFEALESAQNIENNLRQSFMQSPRNLQARKTSQVSSSVVTLSGEIACSEITLREIGRRPWATMAPAVTSRLSQIVDALPLTTVHTMSVVAVMTNPFYGVEWPFVVSVATTVIADAKKRSVEKDLDSLLDDQIFCKVKSHLNQDITNTVVPHALEFANPAMCDLILSVTLPNLVTAVRECVTAQWSSHSDPESPLNHLALAYNYLHLGNRVEAEKCIQRGYPLLVPDDDRYDLIDVVEWLSSMAAKFNVSLPSLIPGFEHVQTEMLWTASVAQMPQSIVDLKSYMPPLSLGFMTVALRRTALFLRQHAINVGAGEKVMDGYEEELAKQKAEILQSYEHQVELMRAMDSFIGYWSGYKTAKAEAEFMKRFIAFDDDIPMEISVEEPPIKEMRPPSTRKVPPTPGSKAKSMRLGHKDLIDKDKPSTAGSMGRSSNSPSTGGNTPALATISPPAEKDSPGMNAWPSVTNSTGIERVAECASLFLEYANTAVLARARACEAFCAQVSSPPVSPPHPFWGGSDRISLELALRRCIEKWDVCQTTAVRDTLLVLATEGYIPVNPDFTVEYQCDCYLRRRTHPYITLRSFLFSQLLYPAHRDKSAETMLRGGAVARGMEQLDLAIQTKIDLDESLMDFNRNGAAGSARLNSIGDHELRVKDSLATNVPDSRSVPQSDPFEEDPTVASVNQRASPREQVPTESKRLKNKKTRPRQMTRRRRLEDLIAAGIARPTTSSTILLQPLSAPGLSRQMSRANLSRKESSMSPRPAKNPSR